jgi:hypothetical protein
MKKDTKEAIQSVVGSLPKIDQLKPEQEQALLSFVGGHDVVVLLPTGFGKSLIFLLAPLASPHRVREKFDFPAGSVSGEGAGPVARHTSRPNAMRLVMADPEWHWADPIQSFCDESVFREIYCPEPHKTKTDRFPFISLIYKEVPRKRCYLSILICIYIAHRLVICIRKLHLDLGGGGASQAAKTTEN